MSAITTKYRVQIATPEIRFIFIFYSFARAREQVGGLQQGVSRPWWSHICAEPTECRKYVDDDAEILQINDKTTAHEESST